MILTISTVVFMWFLSLLVYRCATDEETDALLAIDMLDYFGIIVMAVFGVTFIFVGIYLKYKLKKWNEEVEEKARSRINFATYVLSIPFLIRALYNIIRKSTNLDEQIDNSIRDDTWFAPIILFLFILIADIVPITSQLVSMLVVVGKEDTNNRFTELEHKSENEESEYINSIINAVTNSSGGSFLEDNPDPKKRNLVDGSREYSSGINFSNGSGAAIHFNHGGASSDSD